MDLRNLFKNKLVWLSLGIILLLAVGIGVFFYLTLGSEILRDKDVIASVGDKKITKRDLNEQIYGIDFQGTVDNPSAKVTEEQKKELLDRLIEDAIAEKAAQEKNITVSNEEIEKEANQRRPDYPMLSSLQKDLVYKRTKADLLLNKVKNSVVDWRQGKFIIVRFDLHFSQTPTRLSQTEREKLIPQDKEYATQLINSIHSKIVKNEISFEKGMEIANNDARLGAKAWEPWRVTLSQSFSKEDSLKKSFPTSAPEFWKEVFKTPSQKMSSPTLVKVSLPEDLSIGKEGSLADGLYLIVKNEEGPQEGASSYEEWLNNQKAKLGVKIY